MSNPRRRIKNKRVKHNHNSTFRNIHLLIARIKLLRIYFNVLILITVGCILGNGYVEKTNRDKFIEFISASVCSSTKTDCA